MNNYIREVIYLNEYRNGNKSQGKGGYARLERRQGTWSLSLFPDGTGITGSAPVYIAADGDGKCYSCFVGDADLGYPAQIAFPFSSVHFMEKMKNTRGVLIGTPEHYLAGTIRANQSGLSFDSVLPWQDHKKNTAPTPPASNYGAAPAVVPAFDAPGPGTQRPEGGAQEEDSSRTEGGAQEEDSPRTENSVQEEGSSRTEGGAQNGGSSRTENGAQDEGISRTENGAQDEGSSRTENGAQDEGISRTENSAQDEGSSRTEGGAQNGGSSPAGKNTPEQRPFPSMYPFEDDEFSQCFQISPKDLCTFPAEHWHLANNSFLLQGFYNYRHLLYTQCRERKYIGIPGQFHRREQYIAGRFGFTRFKGTLKKHVTIGDFGYWLREIT